MLPGDSPDRGLSCRGRPTVRKIDSFGIPLCLIFKKPDADRQSRRTLGYPVIGYLTNQIASIHFTPE